MKIYRQVFQNRPVFQGPILKLKAPNVWHKQHVSRKLPDLNVLARLEIQIHRGLLAVWLCPATFKIMGAEGCMVDEFDSTSPTTKMGWMAGLAQSSAWSVNVRLDWASVTRTPFNPTLTTRTP